MRIYTKTFLLSALAFSSLFFQSCKKEDLSVTVKTYTVTDATQSSGTFHGVYTVVDADIVDAGFVYSPTLTYPTLKNGGRHVSGVPGSSNDILAVVNGLSSDSTYRFRAYASTSDTTYYGSVLYYRPTGISISTVSVPGGSFHMGASSEQPATALDNEKPLHLVTLDAFKIGKYEVTNAQYLLFLNSRQISSTGRGLTADGTTQQLIIKNLKGIVYDESAYKWVVAKEDENRSMVNVTWYGANEFCRWAGGRLPTEAEWEFAARGGADGGFVYSGSNDPDKVAWYKVKILDYPSLVHPGGEKDANGLQLYDMSGNVWEWVSDWYSTYSSKDQVNPTGLTDTQAKDAGINHKVRRGGGWAESSAATLRVSSRASSRIDVPAGSIGFRFAKN